MSTPSAAAGRLAGDPPPRRPFQGGGRFDRPVMPQDKIDALIRQARDNARRLMLDALQKTDPKYRSFRVPIGQWKKVGFAYLTGWRKGEIISLRWADIDRDGGAIRLRPEASKNGKGRTVVLDGELDALMERRWKARLIERDDKPHVTDLVFHRDGEPVGDFRKAWVTACFEAGLVEPVLDDNDQPALDDDGKPKLRASKLFHDLRRTAARNMVRAGVPERVAMEITGHRTRSMFDRYNIVSEDDLRLAAQKTNLYVDTLPTTRTSVALPSNGSR